MSVYINGWRMCPFCQENRALEAHLTCGSDECDENLHHRRPRRPPRSGFRAPVLKMVKHEDIPDPVLPPSRHEVEANERVRKELLRVCRAFVEQSEKLRGFPASHPYAGVLSMARSAIRQAEDLELCSKYDTGLIKR